jgi:hypothetical protein
MRRVGRNLISRLFIAFSLSLVMAVGIRQAPPVVTEIVVVCLGTVVFYIIVSVVSAPGAARAILRQKPGRRQRSSHQSDDPDDGLVGIREPRRPRLPSMLPRGAIRDLDPERL